MDLLRAPTSLVSHQLNTHWLVFLLALIIPVTAHSADEWLYTVQKDDNLWNLSEEYLAGYDEWPRLRELNNISDPKKLPPGSVLRFPIAWLKKVPTQVEIISVFGDVVFRQSKDDPFTGLQKGMLLVPPAEMKTRDNANTTLEFEDGSRLQLDSNSLLRLKTLNNYGSSGVRDTQLDLPEGSVENQVEPKENSGTRFEIITPSALTGVRGTRYRVVADKENNKTRVEVVQGNVAVESGGEEVAVPAGFATIAVAGQSPLAPKPLLDAPNIEAMPQLFKRTIKFVLPQQEGAKGLRVQLRLAADKDIKVFDQTFSGASVSIPKLTAGEYRITVRAIDDLGIEGQSASKAIELTDSDLIARILFLTAAVLMFL